MIVLDAIIPLPPMWCPRDACARRCVLLLSTHMHAENLYELEKKDLDKAVATLKDAFQDDPVWNAVFRDDPNIDKALTGFFAIPLLYGMKFGKAYATSEQLEGVAVWVPGEKSSMGFLRLIASGAVSYGSRIGSVSMKNLSTLAKQLEPDRKRIMSGKSYTYLTVIGVGSEYQGKGYGSTLLKKITTECDETNRYLYLETESEESVRFYERHGFRTEQKIVVSHIDVPMWQMIRPPNAR
ncbi:MAG: GNAT family N-acetyltransferase [Spirochaetaceae bacterium]|nr:MAG: GNAT family N-acetyltransferase [Spirochaetaceae bacterium]